MGMFFTNVQVHTGSLAPEEARSAIIAALREWTATQGMHEFTEEDRLFDRDVHRTVLVGPATDGPWIAVFDEKTEDQRHDDLKDLTRRMSQVTGNAVGVLDQHSDMLALWLAHNGELVDEYKSQQVAGHAEQWRDVLASGATPEQLRSVLDTNVAFAEDLLGDLAPLFDWDAGLSAMGFEYLAGDLDPRDLGMFTRLDLRSTIDPLAARRGSGPPVLAQGLSHSALRVSVGEAIVGFTAMFQSTSGPSTGLGIVVWGPGLDLLDLHGVQLATRPGAELREFELLHSVSTEDSTTLRYVEVADFPIPRGITGSSYEQVTGMSMRRAMAAQYAACIALSLTGSGAQTGTAELHIGVAPVDNREAGQTLWTAQVTVT
jgi:dsDNA-binding SOS-regulon protein